MISTQNSMLCRAQHLIFALCLPMLITACESNDSPLLDLDSIFPPGTVIPANLNNTNTDMLMGQNADSTNGPSNETADEQDIVPLGDESNSGITPELALLTRGPILFESSFNGTAEPIRDIFQFTTADYQISPGENFGVLGTQSDAVISICSYAVETTQYFCLRSFDDTNDRVWHVFNLQSATNGAGFFEFCDDNVTDEECITKLFNNPDGTDTVTITPLNASISLPNASPYFAYAEQGTQSPRSSTAAVGEYDLTTMNILATMANRTARY